MAAALGKPKTRAAAPCLAASERKSCPSNRSPLIATNRSPDGTERESVNTHGTCVSGAPARSSPPHASATNCNDRGSTFNVGRMGSFERKGDRHHRGDGLVQRGRVVHAVP